MRFSSNSISVLIKETSAEKVYYRKRYLKNKIRELDSDKASRYLAAL